MRSTVEAHDMVRAVPGDTRCAVQGCGLTRGAKAHRMAAEARRAAEAAPVAEPVAEPVASNRPAGLPAVAVDTPESVSLSRQQIESVERLIAGSSASAHLAWVAQDCTGQIIISGLWGLAITAEELGAALGEAVRATGNLAGSAEVYTYRLERDTTWCRECAWINGHHPGCAGVQVIPTGVTIREAMDEIRALSARIHARGEERAEDADRERLHQVALWLVGLVDLRMIAEAISDACAYRQGEGGYVDPDDAAIAGRYAAFAERLGEPVNW